MTTVKADDTIQIPTNAPLHVSASPSDMHAPATREFRSEPQNPDTTNIVGSDIKGLEHAQSAPQKTGLGPIFPAHESPNSALEKNILAETNTSTTQFSKYQFQNEAGQRAWLMHESESSSKVPYGKYWLFGTLAKVQDRLREPSAASDGTPNFVLIVPGDAIPAELKLTQAAPLD